jgi:phosphoglycerol transferase MdoB-like AlkP superfamily enzyme
MYIIRLQKKSRFLSIMLPIVALLLFSFLMRLIFFVQFFPGKMIDLWREVSSLSEVAQAFYLGLKFDARVIVVLLLPWSLAAMFASPRPSRFNANLRKILWTIQFVLLFLFVLVFFIDFGHYSYLNFRLNASFLDSLENPRISLQMAWESYPLITGILFITFLTLILLLVVRSIAHRYLFMAEFANAKRFYPLERIFSFLVMALLVYGKLSYFPLRWSEAFFTTDPFLGNLATNPHLSLFETWKFKSPEYDLAKVKHGHEHAANFLGVEQEKINSTTLDFNREYIASGLAPKDYNVVIIQIESLAFNKTSLSGNPLNPTPLLKELAPKSLYYPDCYTPTEATARGVFATLTGIPDVTYEKSSSRNPELTDQDVLMNQFDQYEKFYFLGGSANWGNIRALFSRNVSGIKIYEEGSYHSARTDVWGISDLDLFKEAHAVLKQQTKPFVAYIQTAGFHRPYSIPESTDGFQKRSDLTNEQVIPYGFDSLEEFHSLLFQDHATARFLELASKEAYFKKTLFVLFGDHGLPSQQSKHLLPIEIKTRLANHHVPLLFYGPGWLEPKVVNDVVCSQVDIFPTVMGILDRNYKTKTFGRNLLSPRTMEDQNQAFLFSFHHRPKHISLVDPHFLYVETESTKELFKRSEPGDPKNVAAEFTEIVEQKSKMANSLFETARYLRYFNKKSPK